MSFFFFFFFADGLTDSNVVDFGFGFGLWHQVLEKGNSFLCRNKKTWLSKYLATQDKKNKNKREIGRRYPSLYLWALPKLSSPFLQTNITWSPIMPPPFFSCSASQQRMQLPLQTEMQIKIPIPLICQSSGWCQWGTVSPWASAEMGTESHWAKH